MIDPDKIQNPFNIPPGEGFPVPFWALRLLGFRECFLFFNLLNKRKTWEDGEWMLASSDYLEDNMKITPAEQAYSFKMLKDKGYVEIKFEGTPPIRHVLLHFNQVLTDAAALKEEDKS